MRLFGESSRQQLNPFSASFPTDPQLVMEQELERKLIENVQLHTKLFELEKEQENVVGGLLARIEQLERENSELGKQSTLIQSALNPSSNSMASTSSNLINNFKGYNLR